MPITDEEEIIYFALSNLIQDCYNFLETVPKAPKDSIPKEDIEMVEYILKRASEIEEKKRLELQDKPYTIQRPNWAELEAK